MGVLAHHGARQQGRARAHAGAFLDVDGADVEDVAVQPVAGEIDLRFHRGVLAQGEQARHRWQRVQVYAALHLHAQGPGVVIDPGGTGNRARSGGIGPPFRGPDAQVGRTTARIIAGRNAGGNQACAKATDGNAPQRRGKDEHQRNDQPPREGLRPLHAQGRGHGRAQHEPAQPGSRRQRHGGDL